MGDYVVYKPTIIASNQRTAGYPSETAIRNATRTYSSSSGSGMRMPVGVTDLVRSRTGVSRQQGVELQKRIC